MFHTKGPRSKGTKESFAQSEGEKEKNTEQGTRKEE